MKFVNLLLMCVMVSCGKDPALIGAPEMPEPLVPVKKELIDEFPALKLKAIKNFAIGFGSNVALSNSMAPTSSKEFLRAKILRSINAKLEHGYHDEVFSDDLLLLNHWSDEQLFSVENRLKNKEIIDGSGFLKMELEFNKQNIKDASLSIYSFSPMDFSLNRLAQVILKEGQENQSILQEIEREKLFKAILEKHQFYLKINDGTVMDPKFAKIIISKSDKTEMLKVDAGKRLDELVSFNQLTSLSKPMEKWKEKSWSKMDKGKWFFLGDYGVSSKVKAGETYVVAHAKWWEIYNASRPALIKNMNVNYENIVSDIGPGTVITFTIQGKRPVPIYEDVEQVVEYGIKKGGYVKWGNWCTVVAREYSGVQPEKIIFSPELAHLPFSFKIGEKIYHINKLLNENAKLMLFNDGKRVKFKLHLPGELLSKTQSIRIKVNQGPSVSSGSTGIVSYGTCQDSPSYILRETLQQLRPHAVHMPLFDSYEMELRVERSLVF